MTGYNVTPCTQTSAVVKRFYACLEAGEAYRDSEEWQKWQLVHPSLAGQVIGALHLASSYLTCAKRIAR